jgi:dCTP deaminase
VILTDREIQIALERKLIQIDPPPDELAYSSTSVDLTLDPRITQFRKNLSYLPRAIDVTHPEYDYDTALEELSIRLLPAASNYQ